VPEVASEQPWGHQILQHYWRDEREKAAPEEISA
jgi:hypothetical protein